MSYLKLLLISILLIIGCKKSNPTLTIIVDTGDSGKQVIATAKKIDQTNDLFSLSNYSFLQANNSGLYVTPSSPINNYALYKFVLNPDSNIAEFKGIVKTGRGPLEIERISMSSKSITGDSLFFGASGKNTLVINQKGEIFDWEVNTAQIPNFGFSFSYNNKRLLIPSFSPLQLDHLFSIYDLENDTLYKAFPPRVPFDFKPAIRNEILGETPVPNGFAISFIGDRKIYLLNFEGKVENEIILGESDPIPAPYKEAKPNMTTGAKPYITKMEFYKENLLVLMDNVIWFLDYPSFKVNTKLILQTDDTEAITKATVIDFSISDDYLYSRIGRKGIYITKTDKKWME